MKYGRGDATTIACVLTGHGLKDPDNALQPVRLGAAVQTHDRGRRVDRRRSGVSARRGRQRGEGDDEPGVRVRVPASSANLGPGFDVLAVALDLWLELEVGPAREFSFTTDSTSPRIGRTSRSRRLQIGDPGHAAFTMRSQIPMSGGMGSQRRRARGGVFAALVMGGEETGRGARCGVGDRRGARGSRRQCLGAVRGGVSVELPDGALKLNVPQRLGFVIVAPHEAVDTPRRARRCPPTVPMADALQRRPGDGARGRPGLPRSGALARGLGDRLHQPHRAHLYPRSSELISAAPRASARFDAHDQRRRPHGPALVRARRRRRASSRRPQKRRAAGLTSSLVDPSDRGAEVTAT